MTNWTTDFGSENFPFFFWMAMLLVLHPMVYVFLSWFVCSTSSEVNDFNNRNEILITKFHKQGFRYNKLRTTFYRRHSELMCNIRWFENNSARRTVRTWILWRHSLFIQNNCRQTDLFVQFKKPVTRYKKIGYFLRQTACTVVTELWLVTLLPSLIAVCRSSD